MPNDMLDQARISFIPETFEEEGRRVKSDSIIPTKDREPLPLPLTGLILCGGQSKRMGRSKAFLPFGGKTIIEHLLGTFNQLFDEVFLVTNEPANFSQLSAQVVKDILPQRGPICGILSGLLVASYEHAFVVACDMPLVDRKLIRQMSVKRHDADITVLSHSEQIEPLFGIYSKSCIKSLEDALFSGDMTVMNVLSGVKAKTFEYPEELTRAMKLPAYFNVNTPHDYSELLNITG
jgi:molybdopterin-guanine dinucleotide biosynthesis protein A